MRCWQALAGDDGALGEAMGGSIRGHARSEAWQCALGLVALEAAVARGVTRPAGLAADDLADVLVARVLGGASVGVEADRATLGYDTSIIGWGWTPGTFAWVEPTAYAVLALKRSGHGRERRVAEGERLLLDRSCAAGGWNYGSPRVFETDLAPDERTTAIALLALQDRGGHAVVRRALATLADRLPASPSVQALALGALAFDALTPADASVLKLIPVVQAACEARLARREADGNASATDRAIAALARGLPGRNPLRLAPR